MTEPETRVSSAHQPPQRRGFGAILSRAFQLYFKNWRGFTGVLAWPVTQIFLGFYASQALSLWLMDATQPFALTHSGLIISGVLLIAFLSVCLICRGTWQYLVYWASLCLNVWEAEEENFIDYRTAYNTMLLEKRTGYAVLAGAYFSLPLITLLPVTLLSMLGSLLGPQMLDLLFLVGLLQSFILIAAWLFSLVPLSFVFQIAAFERGIPLNPLPTFTISLKLALKRFWTLFFMQILVFLITNALIPQPLVWLARLTHVSAPLDWLHGWILRETFTGSEEIWQKLPLLGEFLTPDPTLIQIATQILSDLCLSTLITLLLLPLGTFVFTLLYKDILKCDRSKKTFLGI